MQPDHQHAPVYLITGATDGIGKALAMRLASEDARLILHGRNKAKLAAVVQEIRNIAPAAEPRTLLADFASLEQVSAMANEINADHSDVNVLINNAGHLNDHRRTSADGLELTFAVNYLAPYLLTRLLLPVLKANAPARIVNISSTAMGSAYLDFADLQLEQRFEGWQAYANSKLAQIYFTHTLAQQLAGSGVSCFSLCPGLIDTNFMHTNTVFSQAARERMRPIMRPAEQGADVPYYLATSADVLDASGEFFVRDRGNLARAIPLGWDDAVAQKLWSVSNDYVAEFF
jgi:NAD(P)-dependent dehydrogenase (short-subunit alcohol dehydrogenase family)